MIRTLNGTNFEELLTKSLNCHNHVLDTHLYPKISWTKVIDYIVN